jgi:hypothetical protein
MVPVNVSVLFGTGPPALTAGPDVTINDFQIPRKTEIKYLMMTLDSKLTWKQHIVKKRKQVNITIK